MTESQVGAGHDILQVLKGRIDLEGLGKCDDASGFEHLQLAIIINSLAHNHFASLISDLGPNLLGVALDLGLLDVACVAKVVGSETVQQRARKQAVTG